MAARFILEEELHGMAVAAYESNSEEEEGEEDDDDDEEEEEEEEEERVKRRRVEVGDGEEAYCSIEDESSSQNSDSRNRLGIDAQICSICMEPWTSDGDHHICCLACGHLFGMSCIKRWIRQNRSSAKCPQCNRKCLLKDVRKLFVPAIAAVDQESQNRIQFLEDKCASLEKKDAEWSKKESEWKKREAEFVLTFNQLERRTNYLELSLERFQKSSGVYTYGTGEEQPLSVNGVNSKFFGKGSSSTFVLQKELRVDFGRLFDIYPSGEIILLARKLPQMGGFHVITKISLIPPYECEDIFLPPSTKMIKCLHISPSDGSLALYASVDKKLSVLSMESNNIILSYDLPVAASSCAWDLNNSCYIYAGLQNGSLLMFDVRQTIRPVETRLGLSSHLIHNLYPLQQNPTHPSGIRTVMSASSIGMCHWNLGGSEERPSLVLESANQGVCISLAHCPSSGDIVASCRPRVETTNEMPVSQPVATPSPSIGQGVLGSLIHMKRVGSKYEKLGIACATVSDIRLPRSVIIDIQDQKPLFAAGNETTHGLSLQELPSFTVAQHLKPHKHFIRDVRYTTLPGKGLLGCLSEDTLQLFSNLSS